MSYRTLIDTMATRYSLDASILEAQVLVESSGQTDAFRFEPGIWTQLVKGGLKPAIPLDLKNVEPRRVASSYGLLQVLYITALDYGYRGEPEGLFLPEEGLTYGCKHLQRLLVRSDIASALATYNGGAFGNGIGVTPKRNQAYVDRVMAMLTYVAKRRKTLP